MRENGVLGVLSSANCPTFQTSGTKVQDIRHNGVNVSMADDLGALTSIGRLQISTLTEKVKEGCRTLDLAKTTAGSWGNQKGLQSG